MKVIDFDAHYAQYAEKWMRENMDKFKNPEQMERQLPGVYVRWLNERASYLDGLTPGEYFARMSDPDELVALLRAYAGQQVDVPDLLAERIVELGGVSVKPLMALAADADAGVDLRIIALNMLIELNCSDPVEMCLQLVDARAEEDELADAAADLLSARGAEVTGAMLSRLEGASDAARATYLDLLCNFPGDERIYKTCVEQFLRIADKRALYASYLAKLGDARAVEPLRRALGLSDLNYLDYIEIRNAIEALGEEVTGPERSFDGDPYYESLKSMQ